MRPAGLLFVIAVATLALVACSDNEEQAQPTPVDLTPTLAGDVIICPQIAVAGEATPGSPTPQPSCEPGQNFSAQPGVDLTTAVAPPLPSGTSALTDYFEIETDEPGLGATVSLPLTGQPPIGKPISWFVYTQGVWLNLDNPPTIHESTISGQDGMASGTFDVLPENLILLAAQ